MSGACSVADVATTVVLAEILAAAGKLPVGEIEGLCNAIMKAPHVFVHGVGRCGLVMRSFAVRLAQLGIPVAVVGEPSTVAGEPGDLLLVGSGSGRTETILAIARRARAAGLHIIALTASADAPLAAVANNIVLIPGMAKDGGGNLPSRQPPGSLFEQMLMLFCEEIVLSLTRIRDPGFAMIRCRHANLE
jgi:6-phospho-3-hexuloisomerase